jgi:predicted NUDIX family NTP pyrophosphohydrolase
VARRSAGLLLYRLSGPQLELLLAHPGGPVWARRDEGAWSIIKGEYAADEEPLAAARREFAEETGSQPPDQAIPVMDLGEVRQRGGKLVLAFAVEGDFDAGSLASNTFSMEWPRRSGRVREFPEIDRAAWFDAGTARRKLLAGQVPFVERLELALAERLRARGSQSTSVAP